MSPKSLIAKLTTRRPSPRCLALAAALAVGACGTSPSDHAAVSSHSALTPNEAPAPTTYTIALKAWVHTAQEPPLSVPRTLAAPIWTPDTGFNDWAELAVAVNAGNPVSTACDLGVAGTDMTLNNCVGGGMNNGAFTVGKPLSLSFQTTQPTDTVNVELIMDNVEQGFAMSAQNTPIIPDVTLNNDLQVAGNTVGVIGAFVGAVNAWAGAIVASIGATLSIVGTELPPQTTGGQLATPITCAGGLLGQGPGNKSTDSMYLSFTGAELAQLTDTSTGSNVLTLNPSVTWGHGCASNMSIYLTIARTWADGVGPSPKSPDFAVARTTTENDAFWANPAVESIDRVDDPGTGWQAIHIGSSLSVAGTPPVTALSNNPNDLQLFWVDDSGEIWSANGTGPSPTLVNATPAGVRAPASANLTAAERFPGCYDYAFIDTTGAVDYEHMGAACQDGWDRSAVAAAGSAPPGAPLAMLARTFANLDLFFVGDDGQLRASSTGTWWGASWSTQVVAATALAPAGAHIAAASPITQALDVFYIDVNGALRQASWTPLANWTNVAISPNGVAAPGAPVSVVSRTPTSLDVAFIGTKYNVVWASSTDLTSAWTDGGKTSGAAWSFTTLPKITPAFGPVSIVAGTSNNLDVFYGGFGGQFTGHWDEPTDTWAMSAIHPLPPPYTSTVANDRYWHDGSGNVYHQDGYGSVNELLDAASSGYGAFSSLAAYSYPDGGQSVWFVDTLSPARLRQLYVSPTGGHIFQDWGTPPTGCMWTGKPAATSWGQNRADIYQEAYCYGVLHLFHYAYQDRGYGWVDISPPGQLMASAPAATTQQVGSLDVVVLDANDEILYGSCYGECTGADFTWSAPSGMMRQGGYTIWFSDLALASPAPGVLFAFAVDNKGNIDYSQWTTSTLSWSASATWYASPSCVSAGANSGLGGPAVVRTGPNSLFVACTTTGGDVNGGWGDTSLQTPWWNIASGVSGAPALTAH